MRQGFQVTLAVKAVKNPVPFLAPDGDCGACAACAVLGWPQDRVAEIYRMLGFDPPTGLTLHDMRRLLDVLKWEKGLLEDWQDVPIVPRPDKLYPTLWGYPAWTLGQEWFQVLQLRLQSGWVGLTVIDFDGRGCAQWPVPEGDHWVLLTGAIARWEPNERAHGSATWREYVRVTDSSTHRPAEWWEGSDDFLRRFGGFRVFWLLPAARPAVQSGPPTIDPQAHRLVMRHG